MTEWPDESQVEINAGSNTIWAVAFAANGKHLVGGSGEVRVWQVGDKKERAVMTVGTVNCLAVSNDGKRTAAGTGWGKVFVWNTEAYHESVFEHWESGSIRGVDFSPDAARLAVASGNCTATVWDVATSRRTVDPLRHESVVTGAKFSAKGDQIATTTQDFVRIWDSNVGHLLVEIPVKVTPWYNTGLLWFCNHIIVVSDNKIKRIDASTGSEISEWSVPDTNHHSAIALPWHRGFVAYATNRIISFWDTSTHTQLGLVQQEHDVRSIALSPDDQSIAIGGDGGKITIKSLSRVTVSVALSSLHPAFWEPESRIDDVILDSWKNDQLMDTEVSLTSSIPESRSPSSLVLACRALVRTRLEKYDDAMMDAEESIQIQPSVIGYIAKSKALIGKGERHKAYRVCDIAFEHFHSTHISFLLLTKAIIVFMAGEYDDALSRVDDLISTVCVSSMCYTIQAYMYLLIGNSRMESSDFGGAIQSFENAQSRLQNGVESRLVAISLMFGWKFDDLGLVIKRSLCEALYAAGHRKKAENTLLEMVNIGEGKLRHTGSMSDWAYGFIQRCLSASESGSALGASAPTGHSIHDPTPILREWAKVSLFRGSWKDALVAAANFALSRFVVYQAICESLETADHVTDAIECLQEMLSQFGGAGILDKQEKWVRDFKQRCIAKLTGFGDEMMVAQLHDDAIFQFSVALSLSPTTPHDLFFKRSRAFAEKGSWEDALNDANEVIKLDPISPRGYERKFVALQGAGFQKDMLDAFDIMLSKMLQSPNPDTRVRRDLYAETMETIRKIIQDVIRESPRVLINTSSGRLCDKSQQAAAFESSPTFTKLILSMTTRMDRARIEREIKAFYRYATFSHKWEANEPLYDKVLHIVVYELEESLTHEKLQMFCKIVRDAGFNWAWSDTCCINKADHFVLQEALVAMFKWYEGSDLTIVLLRGVRSPSRRGDLVKSVWNTRAWTFQEYHASKVVRFYTEDWKPYLDLDVANHKKSPEIISEMEEATGISVRALTTLRPGLDDIREKLCLASGRETTYIEDAAYSLLGIFSASLPVVYGEGDKALGRLLAQLLTSSGDTTILAWTGKSGSFNSCLPASITVFSDMPTTHIPSAINSAEMNIMTARSQSSSLNSTLVMELYDKLVELPVPSFAGQRMKLPCLTFKLGPLSGSRSGSEEWVYRAQTTALGIVEIRTNENLSGLESLCLVHPWLDFLLDRQPVGGITETLPEQVGEADDQSSPMNKLSLSLSHSEIATACRSSPASRLAARLGLPFAFLRDEASLRPPSSLSQADKQTRALRVCARIRQPFGALLLTPNRGGGVAAYRRVAVEHLITVRVVGEITPEILNKLIRGVRVLDVL